MSLPGLSATPTPSERIHRELAETILEITRFSETEVLSVGARVGRMVELAEAQTETLRRLEGALDLEQVISLSGAQRGRLLSVLERIERCTFNQMVLVEELSQITVHVVGSHNALRRGIQAARLMTVQVRVEGAVLAGDGEEVKGLSLRLRKLGERMRSASEHVVALLDVLRVALPLLLRRLRVSLMRTEDLRRAIQGHSFAITRASTQFSSDLHERIGRCQRLVDNAISASHRALSALQFQDPMIQALQGLDPLTAAARVAAGEREAMPIHYGAGLASDSAQALCSGGSAPAPGETLLF